MIPRSKCLAAKTQYRKVKIFLMLAQIQTHSVFFAVESHARESQVDFSVAVGREKP